MIDKEQAIKENKKTFKMIMIFIIVFSVAAIIFSVVTWYLKLLNTKENDKDPKNAPAAARNYLNNTNIDGNGKITLGKSIADWWEELVDTKNKITDYLDSPEELAKIMNAVMALEYPDTRENPDEPIDWNKIDINSKEIQGIVKFKRALQDGKTISMTYVSPSEFQKLISKYNNAKNENERKTAREEALKHFTMEKTVSNSSTGGSPIVQELLKYSCSWVGKLKYKSKLNGMTDNEERFLPLKEGRGSDCSHFVHWCFEHVGLMDKEGFVKSKDWGSGGDAGGCPGTVKIGTDLSQASPGDVLWWHGNSGVDYDNHVAIYLGNGKMVECAAQADNVIISNVSQDSGIDQILHFSQLPKDPTGYFDPDTMTLHSSISGDSGGYIGKVPSLRGMVFMGDSILSAIRARSSLEKGEGAITMYQSGCSAEFFLGEEDCSDISDTNCRDGRYFDWNKQFSKITNPTGFYLMLGQNFFGDKSHRIERMDRLVQKIRSQYPSAPIYISSVLRYLKRNDSNHTRDVKEETLAMNEELKIYCLNNNSNNVFYSDVLKGYDESDEMLISHTYDDDHPNEEGAKIILNNIKTNIVGTSSSTSMTTASTSTSLSNSVTGEMIVQEAEKYVGKLPYVERGESLETGADCSGFVWAILKKYGLIDFGRTSDAGFRDKGTEVKSLEQAQAGDVICYYGHIGFYDGKGGVIHESNKQEGCKHSAKAAYRKIATIRRFTNASSSDEEILKITAIDFRAIPNSGWGDGIMLSSNGYNLLMDTFREACRESLDKYLRENNINKFDIYISHDHHDHVDNLYHLIDNYDVSKVYIPNLDGFGLFSVNKLKEKGVEVIPLEKGDTFEIGGPNCIAEVIYGPDTSSGVTNNESLVTMIRTKTRIGDVKYLTGGDIEEYAANRILEQGIDVKADIMKADHHGGGDSPSYIKQVNPSFYLIDYLDKYDSWVQPQVDAAEECGNVFSTYNNGEVSFSIKASGNIVPTAQRNVEQVEFNVQDNSGKTYTVTYTLNKDSSHIFTDQMKRAALNISTGTTTINSTYKVKVATWSERRESVSSDDPDVKNYDTGFIPNMTTTTIPYQPIVSKYKMPFNYLWTMLVYSQDKDYVFDLAELVDNSKIEITIHDNYTETTNIVTDKYTNYKKAYTTATADVYYKYKYIDIQSILDKTKLIPTEQEVVLETNGSKKDVKVDGVNEESPDYTTVHTTINRNNTLDIALTLADSWFVKYSKEYKYNKLTETPSYENTESLPDIENDKENVKGDFGGNKEELEQKAKDSVDQSWITEGPNVVFHDDVVTEYTTKVINRSKHTKNIVKSSSYVASVPGSSGSGSSGYSSTVTNVSIGDINSDSLELIPEVRGDGTNHQQGFCFAGDDLIVYAIVNSKSSPEVCSLYLVDAKTMKVYDSIIGGLSGHGNSIAYDSKTGDVIFPETGVMKLIPVNKTTKTFDKNSIREQALPDYARNTPSIAYNENKDLFICKENVYTREAFYSNGKPLKKMNFKMPANNLDYSGATAYGNQVYYFYCDPRDRYAHGNYIVICNLDTGNQEETLYDSTPREGEEISFTSDGTLYICYGYGRANGKRGSVGTSFNKTDYSYINDNNIDKSNVTIGSSATTNDITRYNTGGIYDKENGFVKVVKVFNSHYNARSNILSVTEWLFEALEQNSDTEKMVEITQYLLHKATGNNYGEYGNKEFDYEAYMLDGFTDIAETGGKSGIPGIQGQIYDYFLAKGVPPVGVAAIMGNIQAESGFRPDAVNSLGYSGLCQWGGGRLTNLKKLAESRGKDWTDVECQLDHLWEELNSKNYSNVKDTIMAAVQENQLQYATWYWGSYFEVYDLSKNQGFEATKDRQEAQKRYKYAQHWYQEWQQHHTSGTGGIGVINPGGITTQAEADKLTETYNQMLNTKVHDGDSSYQSGPFPQWWSKPYNQLSPFQCTWWANGRASMYLEQYGTKYKKYPTQWGNGGEYYSINIEKGYFNYGSTPKPNSLVSMPSGSSYGHVAYVEGVTSEGIWISDAGSGKSWRGVRFRKFSDLNVYGYIYLDEPK